MIHVSFYYCLRKRDFQVFFRKIFCAIVEIILFGMEDIFEQFWGENNIVMFVIFVQK